MKVQVSGATGATLDWMVGAALNKEFKEDRVLKACRREATTPAWIERENYPGSAPHYHRFDPSTDWRECGMIIDIAGINVMLRYGSLPPNHVQDMWDALIKPEFYSTGRPGTGVMKEVMGSGPTAKIAACRAYAASRLGYEVEVPDELA